MVLATVYAGRPDALGGTPGRPVAETYREVASVVICSTPRRGAGDSPR